VQNKCNDLIQANLSPWKLMYIALYAFISQRDILVIAKINLRQTSGIVMLSSSLLKLILPKVIDPELFH